MLLSDNSITPSTITDRLKTRNRFTAFLPLNVDKPESRSRPALVARAKAHAPREESPQPSRGREIQQRISWHSQALRPHPSSPAQPAWVPIHQPTTPLEAFSHRSLAALLPHRSANHARGRSLPAAKNIRRIAVSRSSRESALSQNCVVSSSISGDLGTIPPADRRMSCFTR